MKLHYSNDFMTNSIIVVLGASFCSLLWGSSYPAIKVGYELLHIAPFNIVDKLLFGGYRFLIAGIIVLLYAKLVNHTPLNITGTDICRLSCLGFFQTGIQYTFFYVGLAYTTGTNGSIMNATTTFFSVFLAHCIYRNDHLTANKLIGCVIGFIGVVIVNIDPSHYVFNFTFYGEGLIIISAFLLSAAAIYGKELSQRLDVFIVCGYQLSIGGLAMIIIGYLFGGHISIDSWKLFGLFTFLILNSSVSFGLWTLLLKYNPVSKVAPFNFLVPIMGAGLSALFLNEAIFKWTNLIALILVCFGILLVNKSINKKC